MKKIVLYGMLLSIILLGCEKEGNLFTTKVNDLYVFKPNDSDPLKKRLYEIYEKYEVAVFFTDTVGEYFVRNDIEGNPVYRTERLDLAWYFNYYNKSSYQIEKIKSTEEQIKALDYVEKYLQSISKPLFPFSILLAREVIEVSNTGQKLIYNKGKAKNYFRTLLMTDMLESTDTVGHFKEIVKTIIRVKINDFPTELTKFGSVCKSEWYGGKQWNTLNPSVAKGTSVGLLYSPAVELNYRIGWGWDDARIAAERLKLRPICGPFGFVSGNNWLGGAFTCDSMTDDLDGFIHEMLSTNKKTFLENWGIYPLVMKKYGILHELILNNLGVDL